MSGNKLRGLRFRQLVALVLQTQGHPNAAAKVDRVRLSDALRAEDPTGDIWGIPGWTILTKAQQSRDLSTALDDAEHRRVVDETQHGAVAFHRPGRPPEETYVLMTLQTFATVAAETTSGP
jgi:hypothetical protein